MKSQICVIAGALPETSLWPSVWTQLAQAARPANRNKKLAGHRKQAQHNRRLVLGRFGEDLAARYLQQAGFAIVERNWRCRWGEIDLVARQGELLVFVEVKTRTSLRTGGPRTAFTQLKLRRMRLLAERWLLDHQAVLGGQFTVLRIDALLVSVPPRGAAVIEHLADVA